MKIRQRIFAVALLGALTLAGTQALADTASVNEVSTAAGMTINLLLPVKASADNYFTGSQNILVNGASFLAFCVDPFQYSSGSAATYNVSSALTTVMTDSQAANVAKLYSQSYAGTAGDNLNSAAFQLALWELSSDNAILTSGVVHTTGSTDADVVAAANSMLSNVANNAAGATQYSFTVYTHPTQQDFLVTVTAVPEPETYAMLLAGLGAMGVLIKRRKQRPMTV
jgi:hypothetical protein